MFPLSVPPKAQGAYISISSEKILSFIILTLYFFEILLVLSVLTSLIYQIQEMQDELDYLRTEISSNKDNKTVVGSNTTVSFGDLTETTVKGKTTYSITLTATRDFGGKTGSQTKSITLTLA